jgi:hypothetical protein
MVQKRVTSLFGWRELYPFFVLRCVRRERDARLACSSRMRIHLLRLPILRKHFRASTHPQLISFCMSQSFFVDRACAIGHHALKAKHKRLHRNNHVPHRSTN